MIEFRSPRLKTRTFLVSIFCACAMMMLCSCEGKLEEGKHPMFIKGKKLVETKDYSEAAKAFKEYIQINPNSPSAHYELAVLYDDVLDDPLIAIYYYRTYLELVPDSQDRENARMWLEQAEKKYFDRNRNRFTSDDDNLKKLMALQAKEDKYIKAIEKLLKENKYLKMKISPESSDLSANKDESLPLPPDSSGKTAPAENADTAGLTPGPIVSKSEVNPQPRIVTYHVQTGDTLIKISKKFYGDTKYVKLILEANKDKVKSPTDLQLGQEIIIPPHN